MRLSTTQFRHIVKNANVALANAELDIVTRQRLVMAREAAFTCVKLLQTGTQEHDVCLVAKSAGIELSDSSVGNRSTWNDTAYTEYALRGCGLRSMPMGFKAHRVGTARVVHNHKGYLPLKGTSNAAYAKAKADENFRHKVPDLKRIVRGGHGASVAPDIQSMMRISALNRDKAYASIA